MIPACFQMIPACFQMIPACFQMIPACFQFIPAGFPIDARLLRSRICNHQIFNGYRPSPQPVAETNLYACHIELFAIFKAQNVSQQQQGQQEEGLSYHRSGQ
jgi:hypothetical protein